MNFELKTIKVEKIYKRAYVDRYRRLGYEVAEDKVEVEDGVVYSVVNLKRDKEMKGYEQLFELENQIEKLCEQARDCDGSADPSRKVHRIILWVIFGVGLALIASGVGVVIYGLNINDLTIALMGWGLVVGGAVLIIVWSCLREKWRLRRVDLADDKKHPGFGIDVYSKKVEECLKTADKLRAPEGFKGKGKKRVAKIAAQAEAAQNFIEQSQNSENTSYISGEDAASSADSAEGVEVTADASSEVAAASDESSEN